MKIKDLLELEILKSSKVLTGDIGLENSVESVMVLEAIDIEKWSRKGQLILTSFYAFTGVSHTEVLNFFKNMKSIGISGLIIKMDRLITMIPSWLIKLCFEYQIPLIKVNQDFSYEAIMLAIYEPILNYQSHLLRTYYEVRQRFTKLERNISPFDQIMREFYQIIDQPCSLIIEEMDIKVNFGKSFDSFIVTNKQEILNSPFTKYHYEFLELSSQDTGEKATAVQANIFNKFTENGRLIVFNKNRIVPEYKLIILENVIDVINERLQMEYLIKKDRFTRMNNLADAILQNTPNNMDELESLLKEAGMDDYPNYQGIAFPISEHRDSYLEKEIRNCLRLLKTKAIFFEHHNYIIVLYNFPDNENAVSKKTLQAKLSLFVENNTNLVFAISCVKKRGCLKEILMECLDVLRFSKQFHIENIVCFSDLGIFSSFVRDNNMENIINLIPEELYSLSEKNPELFETLSTFFKENRNFKKTSEVLFLHPKTIKYRINKIQEILNINLTNPVQLLNYEIATYLLNLLGKKKDSI